MNRASLSHFRIGRLLGRGSTGTVYEAHDQTNGSVVALKMIDSRVAENVYRLKHEFRSLADLQHGNLVRFGELACDEGQWFFTMELIRGQNFIEYVRPLDERSQSIRPEPGGQSGKFAKAAGPNRAPSFVEERLRSALDQLLAALSVIHEAGRTHRDVKPSNVLVSEEGRVVLLDFGLMAALGTTASEDGEAFGTPAFMAPEQVEALDVGAPADLYAVGVMLFLALTGVFPFSGGTLEMMAAKVHREAPMPSDLVPDLPPDLNALCADLLRTDPAGRPALAEVRRRLRPGVPGAAEATTPTGERVPPFVGRASELCRLSEVFEEVALGSTARLVVVDGEPGMGKSTLVQRFLASIHGRALVLSGRCYEQETVPFKGIDAVIDALSEHLCELDAAAEEVVASGVRYLAAVFPVLNRVPAIERTGAARTVVNPLTLRDQAFEELERVFAVLSARRPLIVALDDLHWADEDSIALLRQLLSSPYERACLFVVTVRTGTEPVTGIRELLDGADRVYLGPLSELESAELVDALATAGTGKPEGRLDLMREAEGHPLFLVELLRAQRAGRARTGGTLLDVLWQRVNERDAIERRFLDLLAVAGTPTHYVVIAKAAGLDVGDCQTRLGSLRAAQLVRITRKGDRRLVEPYHDRLRAAIRAHIADGASDGEVLHDHLQLARALVSDTSEAELAHQVFAIVHHYGMAISLLTDPGERLRVAQLHLLAAQEAQLATAHARARDLACRGIALLGTDPWRHHYAIARDLNVERIVAEFSAGDHARGRELFQEVRGCLRSEEEKTDLTLRRIHLETNLGNYEDALAVTRERLKELDFSMPTPSEVGVSSLMRLYVLARLVQRGRRAQVFLHHPLMKDPRTQAIVKLLLASTISAYLLKNELWAWIALTCARLTMRHGIPDAAVLASYGSVLAAFGNHAEGASFCETGIALVARLEGQRSSAETWVFAGSCVHWARPLDDAIAMLRTGLDHAKREGHALYESSCASLIACATYCQGGALAHLRETTSWCAEVIERRRNEEMGISMAPFGYCAGILLSEADGEIYIPMPEDVADPTAAQKEASRPSASNEPRALRRSEHAPLTGRAKRASRRLLFNFYLCNAELGYLLGDPVGGHVWLDKAAKHLEQASVLPTAAHLCLLQVLYAAQASSPTFAKRLRARRTARRGVAKLRAWASASPRNFEASYLIACAEEARLVGDALRAAELYDRAALAASAQKMAKLEAMALELASKHAWARGDLAGAERLYARALDAYERWGAMAKVKRLRRGSPSQLDIPERYRRSGG